MKWSSQSSLPEIPLPDALNVFQRVKSTDNSHLVKERGDFCDQVSML
jgi:hypothetical protein